MEPVWCRGWARPRSSSWTFFQACRNRSPLFMYHTNDVINGVVVHRQTGSRIPAVCATSSSGRSSSTAITSTQGVRISTSTSSNSMALRISSTVGQLSPSFSASLTMVISSPLGDGVSSRCWTKVPRVRFRWGQNTSISRLSAGATAVATVSGISLARLLGSPRQNQHHHGQRHHGGHRSATLLCTQHLGENDGADRSCGNVCDTIADMMVESSLSYFFQPLPAPGGRGIAVLGAAFQADLIQGRKCGLGGGEKGGESATNTTSATQSVILPSSIKITLNFLF